MSSQITIVGAPSSAGAYSPGQEKAPKALREAGLLDELRQYGLEVKDLGDVPGFRWQPDLEHKRAMNAEAATRVAQATADKVAEALEDSRVLMLGGDCTVELGTVAGTLRHTENIGLVYIDLDADLNTPQSTDEGALDWMGVAHLLGLQGTESELAQLGPRSPMLHPEQVYLFAYDNVTSFEQDVIDTHAVAGSRLGEVVNDPGKAARTVVDGWASQFERLLIHLDVDVLDFAAFPLAENTRRNYGLTFEQLTVTLSVLLSAPNWVGLTVTEVNPDHSDDVRLRRFVEMLAWAVAGGR